MNISNFVMFKLIHHQAVNTEIFSSLESGKVSLIMESTSVHVVYFSYPSGLNQNEYGILFCI